MVNYVLSYCKITGASRLFARNFYLPLLRPLTPKDALRTYRITGKWLLGARIQHYIPVLLNHRQKRSKHSRHYGKRVHKHMDDYTYMVPVFDQDNDSHQPLLSILSAKSRDNDANGCCCCWFVYSVHDKRYNIVIEASLETAIRDGDVIDITVSQKTDKLLIKLKNFKKVPVEIQYYDKEDDDSKVLFKGEGATSPDEEKFHHHGKYTMGLAKIFEDKEQEEERWEAELKRIMRRRKRQKCEGSKEWKAMIKETIRLLGEKFECDAKRVIDEIAEPAVEQTIDMQIKNLNATKHVNETFQEAGGDLMDQLPTMKEIPDIIKNMGNATFTEMNNLSGVRVTLPSGKEYFVSGQMAQTDDGEVFVPGQTVENEFGMEYSPGITVVVDNKPTLINGLIMGEQDTDALFLPTQSTITADGQLTFATTPEERPVCHTKAVQTEAEPVAMPHQLPSNIVEEVIMGSKEEEEEVDEHQEDTEESSVEMNSSEMEELDIETMRQKHEQQRLELDRLKEFVYDDGMDDLIAGLEDKKANLQQKLDELRRLSIVKESTLVSYIGDAEAMEIAERITTEPETRNRLSDILVSVVRRAATFRDRNSIDASNIHHAYVAESAALTATAAAAAANQSDTDTKLCKCPAKLQVLLKTALVAANDVFKSRPKDQVLALSAVADIMVEVLSKDATMVGALVNLMDTATHRTLVPDAILKHLTQNLADTKLCKLREIVTQQLATYDQTVRLEKILGQQSTKCQAIVRLLKWQKNVGEMLAKALQKHVHAIKTEEEATHTLNREVNNVIDSLATASINRLRNDNRELEQTRQDALAFAVALGKEGLEVDLQQDVSDLDSLSAELIDHLKRVCIIRQLADKDYSLKCALDRIRKSPERARNDPRIRQLVRESALLMLPKGQLRSSRDVPPSLLRAQNTLAIEDFLLHRSEIETPFLVSRGTQQVVVPKEAARGVLAGRVEYVLLDEDGLTPFKPMHMFSAMALNKDREQRIGNYLNGIDKPSSIRSNSIDSVRDDRQLA